jgi:hypothetical protein
MTVASRSAPVVLQSVSKHYGSVVAVDRSRSRSKPGIW